MAPPTVASAVVLPDPPSSPTPETQGLKRRQSSPNGAGSLKRQRVSASPSQTPNNATPITETTTQPTKSPAEPDDAPTSQTPPARGPKARPTRPIDEKKRSQRLFGGLLGTLSQKPGSSAASKRRAEIEERKKEEARRREEEFGEKERVRLKKVKERRTREGRKVEEVDMRIRHSNLLSMANFLTTTTEPRLYYKPWELRPEEGERMKQQIADVEALVDRELAEFDEKRRKWREEDREAGIETREADQGVDGGKSKGDEVDGRAEKKEEVNGHDESSRADGEKGVDGTTNGAPEEPANSSQERAPEPTTVTETEQQQTNDETAERERKQDIDDTGDVVVEADEDTVIY